LHAHAESVAGLCVEKARKEVANIGVPGTNGFHVDDKSIK
jgi:hypothetical protein